MCDPKVYNDKLPEIAVTTLRKAGLALRFVSRDHDGNVMLDVADKLAAFKALSAAVPDDEDWKRIHICESLHRNCLNCGN
jgi:hypothetical protein